ncbi:MAG: hypothetical protein ACRC7O_02390 [Fimbriiglobus sp.]
MIRTPVFVALATLLAGCGEMKHEPEPHEIPLTIEQWKALPPETKFQIDSYERLKLSEQRLYDSREWDKLYKTTVLPAKAKELPAAAKSK